MTNRFLSIYQGCQLVLLGGIMSLSCMTLRASNVPPELALESVEAAADLGGNEFPPLLIKMWKGSKSAPASPALRTAIANALISRADWAGKLLDAVSAKEIPAADLPMTV